MTKPTGRPRGRPLVGADGARPITLSLDRATVDKARTIGDGNVSRGVRRAVALWPDVEEIVNAPAAGAAGD